MRQVAVVLALALAAALAIWQSGRMARREILVSWENRMAAIVAARVAGVERQIEDLRRQVLFLSRVPPIDGIVRASANGGFDAAESSALVLWERRLQTIFLAYARSNPEVFQVRLIGMAGNGRELIRIDQTDGTAEVMPPARLQAKGDTDYVKMAAALPPGKVYVSPINLNREHGQVQQPHLPALRVATPVHAADGTVFGVVVVNVKANGILGPVQRNMPASVTGYVVNAQGDFLQHPDAARAFGFDLGRRWRLQDQFQSDAAEAPLGARLRRYRTDDGAVYALGATVGVDSIATARDLTLLLALPEADVESAVLKDQMGLLAAMLGGALALGGAMFVYLRQRRQLELQVRRLNLSLEQQVRDRTAQLERTAVLQRAIFDYAGLAIIATAADGTVLMFNPAAERMLGYAAADMIGKVTPARWHDPAEVAARAASLSAELGTTIEAGFDVFTARARRGIALESDWTFIRSDGTRLPVSLTVTALRAADGAIEGFLGIAADMSAREHDRRHLIAARDQLINAARVAQMGIWSWTLADNALEWNERMYELYDVPSGQRGGALNYEQWRARVHPDDVDAAVAKLAGAVAGTDVYDPIFRVLAADGRCRFIQAAATVERDASGGAVRVLGINIDISDQHEAEQNLLASKASAEGENRAKSEFLANMSHEIRSPMNAVLGMLVLLKQSGLSARQFDYADKAERAGRALLGILNDILDFSRVEAGKLTLDPQPFSIDQLLREVAVILSANVGDKDVEVLYEVAAGLPDQVVGDAMRLQQVLINLAGNAIKFTEHGEVVLSVRQLPAAPAPAATPPIDDADTCWLQISIRDTGIGISPEQCQRIFDGFSQAEASTARRYGGSGLGLAISQRLVALMGGTLAVESTVGVGSEFRFHLACRTAPPLAAAERAMAPQMQALRCLVVDDHPIARTVLANMLNAFKWHVDAVDSGLAALAAVERAAAAPFDVIFVDWRMPGMDGWEASRRIRALLPPGCASLIVMVTAHGREGMAARQDGMPAVLDGFLVKPVTSSMLFDTVADALAGKGRGDNAAAGQPAPATVRLAGLRLLVVEDNATNRQVAEELLAHEGALVTAVESAGAAIAALSGAMQRFDCILMDIQMPGMDGYAATRLIRSMPGMASLPIIAMTANAMPSDRAAAFEAGMNDHVGKPFDLGCLVQTIVGNVAGAGDLRRGAREAEAPPPAGSAPVGFDGGAALARFGGNSQLLRQVLYGFSGEQERLLGIVDASLAAVNLGDAGHALHTLKGLAGTIGATSLAAQAAALEQLLHSPGWAASLPVERARLAAMAAQAVSAAHAFAAALASAPAGPGPGPVAPVGDGGLAARLAQLQGLLDASNAAALVQVEQMQRDYGATLPPAFSQMAQAVEQCEFAFASRLCSALAQSIGREGT